MRGIIYYLLLLLGCCILLLFPTYGLFHSYIIQQEVDIVEINQNRISPQDYQLTRSMIKELNESISIQDPFSTKELIDEGYYEDIIISNQDKHLELVNNINLDNEAVGIIDMPTIKESPMPIYLGANKEILKKGVGHVPGTDLPFSGPGTHTVLSAHRGYYGANLFLYINYLKQGDLIYINYLGNTAAYRILGNEIVEPSQIDKLVEKPQDDSEILTLLTCHPLPSLNQRLLVHAMRVPNEFQVEKKQYHITNTIWDEFQENYMNSQNKNLLVSTEQYSSQDVDPSQKKLYILGNMMMRYTLPIYIICVILGIVWLLWILYRLIMIIINIYR